MAGESLHGSDVTPGQVQGLCDSTRPSRAAMTKLAYIASDVRAMFDERLTSLDNDMKRCFAHIDGIQLAPFPAVLYGFATVDYFSSCWKGWNDSGFGRKKKRRPNQTKRMVGFLVRFMGYGKKESQVAIAMWRHKLMHTGEPRLLWTKKKKKIKREIYGWEISPEATEHMKLVDVTGATATHKLVLNPFTLAKELREAVFGAGQYWDQLQASALLQARVLRFRKEIRSYTIELYR
jgi:hypothetical protein